MKLAKRDFLQAEQYLRTVFSPKDIVELRVMMEDGTIWSGRFDDGVKMAQVAAYTEAKYRPRAIYYTLNPIKTANAHMVGPEELNRIAPRCRSSRDRDIAFRNLYLVDIDPERPSGASATQEEKSYASDVMQRVKVYLSEQGFLSPVVIDSGNGYALVYATDNHDANSTMWAHVLKHLASKYNNAHAHIDTSVSNAARVSRLPGTWNRKGENTAERPHRMCMVIEMPDRLVRMTHAPIYALATRVGYRSKYDRPAHSKSGSAPELAIDSDGVLRLIAEFPEVLELGRVTEDEDATYLELLSCPFAGREHNGQRRGKGKTTIRLSADNVGFSCFSDGCRDHTFPDLLRLLKKQTGRSPSMRIWQEQDILKAIARWGGIVDVQDDLLTESEPTTNKSAEEATMIEAQNTREAARLAEMQANPSFAYMQDAFAMTDSAYFQENAAPPTLANYDVDPWDLFRYYQQHVDSQVCHLPEAERDNRRAELMAVDEHAMAAALGREHLYLLMAEKKGRQTWPEEFPREFPNDDYQHHPWGKRHRFTRWAKSEFTWVEPYIKLVNSRGE